MTLSDSPIPTPLGIPHKIMVSRPNIVRDCDVQAVEPINTVTNDGSEPKLRPVTKTLPPAVAGAVVGLMLMI